jgi:hypothetical protein
VGVLSRKRDTSGFVRMELVGLQWIEKERMVDGTLSVFHGASDLGDDRERSNFGGDSTTSNKDN